MALTLTPELTFLVGVAVFWTILYIVAYIFHLDKRGLEVKPAFFMYRSKALNSSIDALAKRAPKLWITLSNMGLAFSIGLMAYAFYFLINNLLRFSQEGDIGFAAMLVFFGAFVEPDEKEFEKASLTARLRMLSAGSSTNLVTALLTLMLLTGLFAAPSGLLIQETIADGPVDRAGLERWDVIQAINGTPIATYADFAGYMRGVKAGANLTLTVLKDNRATDVFITTAADPENKSRAIIGLNTGFGASYQPNKLGLEQYTGVNLYWTLFWTWVFAFSVAVFNMLPLYPFDGERVAYYPLERLVGKRKKELRIGLSAFTLGLFALNIILSIWRYGLLAF